MIFILSEYTIILYFLIIGFSLSTFLFLLAYIFTIKLLDNEKSSIYECGFQPFYTSRLPYDVHFYIIAILFLIFDIEVVFLYP
jgi:NADH-quinone oxidoreductase subunit A